MKNTTRAKFNAYRDRILTLNGAPAGSAAFSIDPTIEQKLENRIRENADFLKKINIMGVSELEGEKLGLDVSGPFASRTDTDKARRMPTQVGQGLDSTKYRCEKTDFDSFIKYNTIDSWAKFPDFQKRCTDAVTRQIARDRLMIGFNGTSVAKTTDRTENPLLEDVNIGWLTKQNTEKPASVMNGVKIGKGGDFKNIDAAVYAARHEFIAPWNRNDTSLVVIMGSGLLVDRNVAAIEENAAATERAALQTLIASQLVGTLRPHFVPFFPADAMMITSLDNLSIYYQEGSRRRHIKDVPEWDRIEDYQSVNESYIVEDVDKATVLTGITLGDFEPEAA